MELCFDNIYLTLPFLAIKCFTSKMLLPLFEIDAWLRCSLSCLFEFEFLLDCKLECFTSLCDTTSSSLKSDDFLS